MLLSTAAVADTLSVSFGVARSPAWAVGLALAGVFALAVWARIVAPDVARAAVTVVAEAIALLWLTAALHSGVPTLVALMLPVWAALGSWAGVRLLVDRRQNTTHALYRFFDARDRLLYVGRTNSPQRRFGQHAKSKAWYGEVATRTVTFLPTHSALVAAEREAIIRERPRHNVVWNGRRRAGWR